MKLFISYSHNDEKYIEKFIKHLSPLKDNGDIEEWYDRKIYPGENWEEKINNNLEDADIICLFISENFLSSPNCKKEMRKALELEKEKNLVIVPIILTSCGWKDVKELSKKLALPTDGKPVDTFENENKAWIDIYKGIKEIIKREQKLRNIEVKEEFNQFLQDTEMLLKSHSHKENVFLDEIFIFPDLEEFDELGEYKNITNFKEVINNLLIYSKVVIAGETLSGKTTLCKVIFKYLREKGYFPVYLNVKNFSGRIDNLIFKAFSSQYKNFEDNDFGKLIKEKLVPIIDNFHLVKDKEKCISSLLSYPHCIITVDDIFNLNIKNEKFLISFKHFKISELKASLRYELIKKWKYLSDRDLTLSEIDRYKEIDNSVELVEQVLGKIIGKGVMPSYPFYILSTLVAYESFRGLSLSQEITSQGYCYQALIYIYLKKDGVKDEEMDIYFNFLTELAFYFYENQKSEISKEEMENFWKIYTNIYTLPIKKSVFLTKLSNLVCKDSFNNYSFRYPYLYYFFVAKYLAENLIDPTKKEKIKEKVEKIINNLHVDENAYITIFLIHHTKNIEILDEIQLNAMVLFNDYKPITLTKDELKFFDEKITFITKAIKTILPPPQITPEKIRKETLEIEDKIEEKKGKLLNELESDDTIKNLKRAIRTVEVIGSILKSRIGSLEKEKLKELFIEATDILLRLLSSIFNNIKQPKIEKDIINFIKEKIKKIKDKKKKLSDEELAIKLFWNLIFLMTYGILKKIITSLGSDKLSEILQMIIKDKSDPSYFIVVQGIYMWYNKNVKIDEIATKLDDKNFSYIARYLIKLMIIEYCYFHPVTYKDRQKLKDKLKLSEEVIRKFSK